MNIEQILKKLNKMRCLKYERHVHSARQQSLTLSFVKEYSDFEWNFRNLEIECLDTKAHDFHYKNFIDINEAQYIIDTIKKSDKTTITLENIIEIENNYRKETITEQNEH